jgi:gluconokinase
MVAILMGVAGSGKTTIGRLLATALGGSFYDGDDFHPPANVAKMAAGHPLDDADRAPWLAALRMLIDRCLREGETAVIACSALKASYRTLLRPDPAQVRLIYLRGTPELLAERLDHRRDHFLPPTLLASQLATLEIPTDALTVDIGPAPAEIVAQILAALAPS